MRDISDAADLMTTAREALLRDLLPALSGERRYAALMIANGMAIAAREHRLGTDASRNEGARLRNLLALLPRDAAESSGDPPTSDVPALRKVICAAIRAGASTRTSPQWAVRSRTRRPTGWPSPIRRRCARSGLFIRRRANRWNSN